ncbi:unnamed protein product, partial [Mesorhabditis belari]|uniref:Transmembrane protein 138 n=1 Tax=Mesorhabditis belari TaxID=2138241 RepID=A0AAF3J4Q6_9BILA
MATGAKDLLIALQLGMIFADLIFNLADVLLYADNMILLMIYILQGTNLVLCIIVLVISFSSTFVFQAGLISLLLKEFSPTLLVSVLYLIASIALHVFTLGARWRAPDYIPWTSEWLTGLYTLQRIMAIIFYAYYKRTAFLLTDPRLHSDNKWLRNQIRMQPH